MLFVLQVFFEGILRRVRGPGASGGGPGVGVLGLTCRGAPATGWLTFTTTAIHSGVLKRNVQTTHYFWPPTLDTLLTNVGNILAK